ncbi:MAG TPA: hypothetical protein VGF99_21305 [Myxococcota bacterium]
MRRFAPALLLATAALTGCTSTTYIVGAEPTTLWENAHKLEDEPTTRFTEAEAKKIARAHDAAHTCEQTARDFARKSVERGWSLMHQCIQRNDFTDLELLVESAWAPHVAASPDAAILLAHVIAVRGGDVENDLRLLRRRKMPVYSLQAALAEPDSYRGRYVLVRGNARNGRRAEGGRSFRFVETKVMAESEWVTPPNRTRLSTRTSGALSDQQGLEVSRGRVDTSSRDETEKREILHNVSVETGRELRATVDDDAPSLEPQTDYVVVMRFEGVREIKLEDSDDTDDEAQGVVVDWFEPESSRFARLSR